MDYPLVDGMDMGLLLPETEETSVVEYAVEAEERGFNSVWKGELWGQNVVALLAAVAERTETVAVGTAIVNVYSRTPSLLAMSANSIDGLSDGRAVLGIGSSSPKGVGSIHGLPFDRPVRRIEETAEILQELLGSGDRVTYHGEILEVEGVPPLGVDVPVYNAALGRLNRRITGRVCDGWLPNNIPFSKLESAFGTVADAAREAGRDPDEITVAPWIHVAVNDADPGQARDAVRDTVAYYVGSADAYKAAVGSAYPDDAERVASSWRAGDRDEARGHVTDEMVADLGCAGTAESVREQLRDLLAMDVIDHPIVDVPGRMDDDRINKTIDAISPDRLWPD